MRIPDSVARAVSEAEAAGGALKQAVKWKPKTWLDQPNLSIVRNDLDSLARATQVSDKVHKISREQVFESGSRGPMSLFIASMVWGFGTTGYGAYRTARILNEAGRDRTREALTALTDAAGQSPEAAWRAMHGGAKLKYLGPAFATKVAYFSQSAAATHPPLIADLNTSWGFWSATEVERSAYSQRGYNQYVETCWEWADTIGCRADTVEFALFDLGKTVREQHGG